MLAQDAFPCPAVLHRQIHYDDSRTVRHKFGKDRQYQYGNIASSIRSRRRAGACQMNLIDSATSSTVQPAPSFASPTCSLRVQTLFLAGKLSGISDCIMRDNIWPHCPSSAIAGRKPQVMKRSIQVKQKRGTVADHQLIFTDFLSSAPRQNSPWLNIVKGCVILSI